MSREPNRRRRTKGASVYADVYVELTLMAFRKLAPTVVIGAVGMIFTTALISLRSKDVWLWKLTVLMVLVGTARSFVVIAFSRKPRLAIPLAEARQWLKWYGTTTFLHCLCLCASTVYNFSNHNELAASLCTIGIFSQCAGIGARPGMRPWFRNGCCLTLLGALALSVIRAEAILATTGGIMIAFFAYAQCDAINQQFDIVVEQIRSRRKLKELAEQDTLTGLANRRHFQQALASVCEQTNQPFAILYIDLDRFKSVNDTFGHATGDILLNRVADRLKKAVRISDLVARLGGDEFSILQKTIASVEDAQALADRIVTDLSTVFEIEGNQIYIGASIGIQLSVGADRNPLLLLAKADTALYTVKQAGGGGFALTGR